MIFANRAREGTVNQLSCKNRIRVTPTAFGERLVVVAVDHDSIKPCMEGVVGCP